MARAKATDKYQKPKKIRIKDIPGESRNDRKNRQNDADRKEWERVRGINAAIDQAKEKARKDAADKGKSSSGKKGPKSKGGRTTKGASSSTHTERRGLFGWNRVDVHTHSRD